MRLKEYIEKYNIKHEYQHFKSYVKVRLVKNQAINGREMVDLVKSKGHNIVVNHSKILFFTKFL